MDTPKVCDINPIEVELEEGVRYSFCTCGLAATQPFCDSAHRGVTEMRSHKFTPEKSGKYWLCMCKHTKNPPFCDGSHSKL